MSAPNTSTQAFDHSWLYTSPSVLTGNAAKVKALIDIYQMVANQSDLSILDIGCIGPTPLQFWEPLLTTNLSFQLTGVDVSGIEEAQRIITERNWEHRVSLHKGSGYTLAKQFAPEQFDIVVATQVLEHVARLQTFIQQVTIVLKPKGEAFFTLDSAHWRGRFDARYPIRSLKNLVKKGLSLIGNEIHYDLPWFDHEIIRACQHSQLEIAEFGYYNLAPLKLIHNRVIPPEKRNELMKLWLETEEWLNKSAETRAQAKNLFLGLYFRVRKI